MKHNFFAGVLWPTSISVVVKLLFFPDSTDSTTQEICKTYEPGYSTTNKPLKFILVHLCTQLNLMFQEIDTMQWVAPVVVISSKFAEREIAFTLVQCHARNSPFPCARQWHMRWSFQIKFRNYSMKQKFITNMQFHLEWVILTCRFIDLYDELLWECEDLLCPLLKRSSC